MKIISSLWLLILVCQNVLAQDPGRLGKHWSLSFGSEISLFSNLYNTALKDTARPYLEKKTTAFLIPEMTLSRTISSRLEAGIRYQHFNSIFLTDRNYLIQTQIGGAYIRRYESARGSIAPLGAWIQGGFSIIRSQFSGIKASQKFQSAGIDLGFGIQRGIGSRGLLDLGWELMLTPQLFQSDMKLAPGFYQSTSDFYKNLTKASMTALRVKLGFLVY